jgi:hypothetical protein
MQPQWVPGGTVGALIDGRVQDHFGDTPIYGGIKRRNKNANHLWALAFLSPKL